jgi:uncharacterized coiled-coil protein SlyX
MQDAYRVWGTSQQQELPSQDIEQYCKDNIALVYEVDTRLKNLEMGLIQQRSVIESISVELVKRIDTLPATLPMEPVLYNQLKARLVQDLAEVFAPYKSAAQ